MPVFGKCLMDILFYDKTPAYEREPCQVRLDEKKIVVTYEEDGGYIEYSGKNDGTGHFELLAPGVDGRASLHMFPAGNILEGYWLESGHRGMWRITLA